MPGMECRMESAMAGSPRQPGIAILKKALAEEQTEIVPQAEQDRTETDGQDVELVEHQFPPAMVASAVSASKKRDADQGQKLAEAHPEETGHAGQRNKRGQHDIALHAASDFLHVGAAARDADLRTVRPEIQPGGESP